MAPIIEYWKYETVVHQNSIVSCLNYECALNAVRTRKLLIFPLVFHDRGRWQLRRKYLCAVCSNMKKNTMLLFLHYYCQTNMSEWKKNSKNLLKITSYFRQLGIATNYSCISKYLHWKNMLVPIIMQLWKWKSSIDFTFTTKSVLISEYSVEYHKM